MFWGRSEHRKDDLLKSRVQRCTALEQKRHSSSRAMNFAGSEEGRDLMKRWTRKSKASSGSMICADGYLRRCNHFNRGLRQMSAQSVCKTNSDKTWPMSGNTKVFTASRMHENLRCPKLRKKWGLADAWASALLTHFIFRKLIWRSLYWINHLKKLLAKEYMTYPAADTHPAITV